MNTRSDWSLAKEENKGGRPNCTLIGWLPLKGKMCLKVKPVSSLFLFWNILPFWRPRDGPAKRCDGAGCNGMNINLHIFL